MNITALNTIRMAAKMLAVTVIAALTSSFVLIAPASAQVGEPFDVPRNTVVTKVDPTAPKRFVVLGDSNTVGHVPGGLANGYAKGISWTASAEFYSGVTLDQKGSYAVAGKTTIHMRNHAVSTAADVLVVMSGTNDIKAKITPAKTVSATIQAVQKVKPKQVIIVAIPPRAGYTDKVKATNAARKKMAATYGWAYVNPWSGMVTSKGEWVSACQVDGVHASQGAYKLLGQRIAQKLAPLAGRTYSTRGVKTSTC